MRKQSHAEAHALDRVLYLLEEGSMVHLARANESFAAFLLDIHNEIQTKSNNLHRAIT